MKEFLAGDDLEGAAEAWAEINHVNDISNLSLAPTKGGCFTVDERKKMNTDEFKELMTIHRKGNPLEGL